MGLKAIVILEAIGNGNYKPWWNFMKSSLNFYLKKHNSSYKKKHIFKKAKVITVSVSSLVQSYYNLRSGYYYCYDI